MQAAIDGAPWPSMLACARAIGARQSCGIPAIGRAYASIHRAIDGGYLELRKDHADYPGRGHGVLVRTHQATD